MASSDYIEVIPDYLLEIPEKYGTHIDIMIEAKMKEQAIFKLYNKYPFLNCKIDDSTIFNKNITSEWMTAEKKQEDCCKPKAKPKKKLKLRKKI